MRAGAHFFGIAFVAVATIGCGSAESSAETSSRAAFVRTGFAPGQVKAPSTASAERHRLPRPSAYVASATRQFNLSKLTLADFGDVEQSR